MRPSKTLRESSQANHTGETHQFPAPSTVPTAS
jgi:hypothetical protein